DESCRARNLSFRRPCRARNVTQCDRQFGDGAVRTFQVQDAAPVQPCGAAFPKMSDTHPDSSALATTEFVERLYSLRWCNRPGNLHENEVPIEALGNADSASVLVVEQEPRMA